MNETNKPEKKNLGVDLGKTLEIVMEVAEKDNRKEDLQFFEEHKDIITKKKQ